MSELAVYVQLGFRHIVSLAAADHIFFLLALAAIYRPRDWRQGLWVVSAFTVGHSITLALAVTHAVAFPAPLIEFLIPLTIAATAAENLLVRNRETAPWHGRYRPVFAGVFGLVHGAGFASYLNGLFVDPIAIPLLGFNVGIELGQVLVLSMLAAALALFDALLQRLPVALAPSPLRLRVVTVSALVAAFATRWALLRAPW